MTSRVSRSTSQPGKRTNSLAFAGMDCHTCASNGERCDRQRPKCITCLDQGRKCGGFAMPLMWDEKRTWLGQTSRHKSMNTTPRDNQDNGDEGDIQRFPASKEGNNASTKGAPRNFRFVPNGKKARKKRKVAQSRKENTPGSGAATATATADELLPPFEGTHQNDDISWGQHIDPLSELASFVPPEQWLDPGNALSFNDTFDLSSSLDYVTSLLPPELSTVPVQNPGTMDRAPAEPLAGQSLPDDTFPGGLSSLLPQDDAAVEGGGVLTTPRFPMASGVGARLVPSAPVGNQSDTLLQMCIVRVPVINGN